MNIIIIKCKPLHHQHNQFIMKLLAIVLSFALSVSLAYATHDTNNVEMKPEKRGIGDVFGDVADAITKPKRYIKLKNLTDKPIRVAVRYLDGITNRWKSRCWKTLGSGVESTDKSSFSYNRIWYYYAESVDGDKIWSGAGYDL